MDRRIVAQLFDSIDFISSLGNKSNTKDKDVNNTIANNDAATRANVADAIIASIDGNTKVSSNTALIETEIPNPEEPQKSKLVVLIAATNK